MLLTRPMVNALKLKESQCGLHACASSHKHEYK